MNHAAATAYAEQQPYYDPHPRTHFLHFIVVNFIEDYTYSSSCDLYLGAKFEVSGCKTSFILSVIGVLC